MKYKTANLKEHPKVKCKSLKWNKLHAYTCSSEYNKTVFNGSFQRILDPYIFWCSTLYSDDKCGVYNIICY